MLRSSTSWGRWSGDASASLPPWRRLRPPADAGPERGYARHPSGLSVTDAGRLVLVVGSGRSGTSLLVGILKALGAHIPQPEVRADASNPRGFGEPQWVVDLHGRLMRRARVQMADARPVACSDAARVAMDPPVQTRVQRWLVGELGLGLRVLDRAGPAEVLAASQLVEPSLRRSVADWDALGVHRTLADLAEETWDAVDRLAKGHGSPDPAIFDEIDALRGRYGALYDLMESVAQSSIVAARREEREAAGRLGPAACARMFARHGKRRIKRILRRVRLRFSAPRPRP